MSNVKENAEQGAAALEAINVSIASWEQRRDAEAIEELNGVISQNLIFRRADKTIVGKQEFMSGLDKPSPFLTRTTESASVEIRGDHALATATVVATKADGAVGRYRNVRVFFLRDERWQLEVWFNDDVTKVTGL